MKTRDYWVGVLERHEAALKELTTLHELGGLRMGYPFTPSVLPLHGLPKKRRQCRAEHNNAVRERLKRHQLEAKQILKLERLIAYARDRIAAIEAQTIFDRLRRGGLSI